MQENSILNSSLYKKIEGSNDIFSVEDLIKEIHSDLQDDRKETKELMRQSLDNANNLLHEIVEVNQIPTLPIGNILGDLPNKFIDNLHQNATAKINLLNSIQKLQSNHINKSRNNNSKSKEIKELSIEELLRQSEE